MTSRTSGDVRDLLGMRTPVAGAMVAVFCGAFLAMALQDGGTRWSMGAAAALCTLACAGVMYLPGDPLPVWHALGLAGVAPAAAALVAPQAVGAPDDPRLDWLVMATSAFLVFMCVRGATVWAWAGLLARDAVLLSYTVSDAADPITAASIVVRHTAPLLIATYFALALRPTARSIFRLREQVNLRAAAESAAAAAVEERDAQLRRLDAVARPLLEQIAGGAQLTDARRAECTLVEAQLRDRLRAGLIIDDTVAAAARAARSRGVSVMLLDDGGLTDAATTVRRAVRRAVTAALTRTASGSVAVRVLPPDREYVATVLVRTDGAEFRAEVNLDGSVRSDLADVLTDSEASP